MVYYANCFFIKKLIEEIVREWINEHKYSYKKSRGEYHEKYVKYMTDNNQAHLSIQKFAKIM